MSAGWPYRCTGMMAAVLDVTLAAAAARVEREPIGIDVREDRPRSRHHDREGRIRGRERARDDFVARAYPHGAKRNRQRVRAGTHSNRMRGARRGGEFLLESFQLRTEHEPSARDDPIDRGTNRRRVFAGRELEERNHPSSST